MLEKGMYKDGTSYFVDSVTGSAYRRVYGGLAWPGARPGFAVLVGEELGLDEMLRDHRFCVLMEVEELDTVKLIRRCAEIKGAAQVGYMDSQQRRYQVDGWFADTGNQTAIGLLVDYNNECKEKKAEGFYLQDAPGGDDPDSFRFCVNILRSYLDPGKKLLYFGENSRLASYLMDLPTEKVATTSASDYPAIAALGYAVAALHVLKPHEGPPLPNTVITPYDWSKVYDNYDFVQEV